MKRPLSTKEITEIGIFRFFNLFSKMWKTCNTDKIGDRVELYLTPTSTLKRGEEKLLQRYFVFLPTR